MATITLKNVTNGWSYQKDSGNEETYYGAPVNISSNAALNMIRLTPGGSVGGESFTFYTNTDTITIDGVTLTGTHAQKVASIKSTLVFKVANSGSGGSGATIERAATKAAISGTGDRFIRVAADETNNGDKSLYMSSGGVIEFLQTIA